MKRFSILIAALCLCLTGCGKQTTEATAQIFAMDTVMEVAAYGSKAEEAVQEAEGLIKALEKQLSRTKADSDVSRVNHNGTAPTTGLTYGTRALLPAALEYRDATNGAFDITIAPVMDAWGFTGDQFRVPEQSELDELLKIRQQRRDPNSGGTGLFRNAGGGTVHRLGGHRQGLYLRFSGADLPGQRHRKR